jgi:hypothetical protein
MWSRIHELAFASIAPGTTTELIAIARKAIKASINVLIKSGFIQIAEFRGIYGSECDPFSAVNTSAALFIFIAMLVVIMHSLTCLYMAVV